MCIYYGVLKMISYDDIEAMCEDYYVKEDTVGKKYFESSWVIGGFTGGNCWGDEANISLGSEEEPKTWDLDDFLLKNCANISFLHYKNICDTLVNYTTDHDYEYYGNCTNYSIKRIYLTDLYEFLVKHGYFD